MRDRASGSNSNIVHNDTGIDELKDDNLDEDGVNKPRFLTSLVTSNIGVAEAVPTTGHDP